MTQEAGADTAPQEFAAPQGAQLLKNGGADTFEESPAKRIKLAEPETTEPAQSKNNGSQRRKGTAPIKQE